jgi:hypothetical protein
MQAGSELSERLGAVTSWQNPELLGQVQSKVLCEIFSAFKGMVRRLVYMTKLMKEQVIEVVSADLLG